MDVGRILYRNESEDKTQGYYRLALAESLLKTGISKASMLKRTTPRYQSNVFIDLARIQTKLVAYGDKDSLSRAKNSLKAAVNLRGNNPMRVEVAKEIAIAEHDWESAAHLSYEIAHQDLPGVFDFVETAKGKQLKRELEYFAIKDAQKGGSWGVQAEAGIGKSSRPQLSIDLSRSLGDKSEMSIPAANF